MRSAEVSPPWSWQATITEVVATWREEVSGLGLLPQLLAFPHHKAVARHAAHTCLWWEPGEFPVVVVTPLCGGPVFRVGTLMYDDLEWDPPPAAIARLLVLCARAGLTVVWDRRGTRSLNHLLDRRRVNLFDRRWRKRPPSRRALARRLARGMAYWLVGMREVPSVREARLTEVSTSIAQSAVCRAVGITIEGREWLPVCRGMTDAEAVTAVARAQNAVHRLEELVGRTTESTNDVSAAMSLLADHLPQHVKATLLHSEADRATATEESPAYVF